MTRLERIGHQVASIVICAGLLLLPFLARIQ